MKNNNFFLTWVWWEVDKIKNNVITVNIIEHWRHLSESYKMKNIL